MYVEKWITFHIDHNGKVEVSIFSGELLPGMKAWRLRAPVPETLIGGEVLAEVEWKQAAT